MPGYLFSTRMYTFWQAAWNFTSKEEEHSTPFTITEKKMTGRVTFNQNFVTLFEMSQVLL